MVRTQIQLTEEQAAILRAMSIDRHCSVAELIRQGIDSFVKNESGVTREGRIARAKSAVGRFASTPANVSTEHDRYLAQAFGGK